MKAAICTKYGPPEVLQIQDVPKPVPKKNQVLIKVHAAAVNSGDARLRGLRLDDKLWIKPIMRLVMGFKGPRNKIIGMTLSGTIEEVGDGVTNFKVGDKVFAMTGMKMGAFAEYVTVKAKGTVAHKPKKASFEEAAAIPFAGTTAFHFLRKGGASKGSKILIYGATGSVGSSAVQVAKNLGAHVTAVCGPDGAKLVKKLGADEVIDYKKDDFTKNGKKYDVVFDAVGFMPKNDCTDSLSENGKYLTVGGLDVAKEEVEDIEQIAKWFDQGKYDAVVDKVYDFEDIVEANRYVDSWRKKGNVVLSLN